MAQSATKFSRGIAFVIALLFIVALVTFAYNGTFSRMMADDYCTAATGIESGAWGGMLRWYNDWSGLYSNFFVKSALASAPPVLYALLPAVLIIGWVGALWIFFRELLLWANIPHKPWLMVGLVLLMSFATINSSPGRQNTYWFGALIPYTLPTIFITLMAAAIIGFLRQRGSMSLILVMGGSLTIGVFMTAGFSETYATFMVTALVLLMVMIAWRMPERRQAGLAFLLPMLLAALAGLLLILLAPGNEIRQARVLAESGFASTPSLTQLVVLVSTRSALFFIIETYGLAHFFFVAFGMVLLLMWVFRHDETVFESLPFPHHPLRAFVVASVVTYLLVAAILTPGLYATQIVAPRITFLPRAIQIAYMMWLGYGLAVWLMRSRVLIPLRKRPVYRITHLALIAVTIFLPLSAIITNLNESAGFRVYATSWDARHALIQDAIAQGETRPTVPELPFYMEDILLLERIEKSGAYNSCGVRFYGAESITVIPSAPAESS